MDEAGIRGTLAFLRNAESLKHTWRSAWTAGGDPESAAQHTWRLCLMAMVFVHEWPGIDAARLIRMCIIHDLGEAIGGDVPAIEQQPGSDKSAIERRDLETLLGPAPETTRREILALWDEYEAATTPEAKLAKALDKLETIMQHNQGRNPPDFDYVFNLGYGTRFTQGDPLIETLRRILDEETRSHARAAGQIA